MPVEVHLDVLVEDAVSTLDCLSVDSLSEVADLLGMILDLVERLPPVRLIEGQEPFRARS